MRKLKTKKTAILESGLSIVTQILDILINYYEPKNRIALYPSIHLNFRRHRIIIA
jgi:hypothetical protein